MPFPRKRLSVGPTPTPAPPRVEWDLAPLVARVREAAPALEARDVSPDLVRARLADHFRDAGIGPPNALDFEAQSAGLDAEGWRCLALAAAAVDDVGARAAIAGRAGQVPAPAHVEWGFLDFARDSAPLTVGLVRQSPVRAEEFARQLSARLGVGIVGETDEQSRARLSAIDYKRLLAEAERAKASAEEKMERLRQRQAEADAKRRRRGKV
jgi:hypothetical protein